MNSAIWIAQIALAFAFGSAGLLKLRQPKNVVAAKMGWVRRAVIVLEPVAHSS